MTEDTEYTPPENPTEIVSLTEDEIKELARDLATGHLFTHWHLPENEGHMLGSVFMPAGLGGLANYDLRQIGLICEHLSKAGPRAVNGYPMFMSMRVINVEQADEIRTKAQAMQEAMGAV